jgi:hypothetical protein
MKWWKDFSNIVALLGIPVGLILVLWGPEDGKPFGYLILGNSFGVALKAKTGKRIIRVKG